MLLDLQQAHEGDFLTYKVVVPRDREPIDAESFAKDDPVFK